MKLAVVLSVYKHSKKEWVEMCLHSLYSQTLQADIFVRIDGEITGELREFMLQEEPKFEVLIDDKENRGIVYSYNQLFQEALEKGYEYIARMDSDDIAVIHRFERQIAFLEANKDIGILGGFIEEFGDYCKTVKYPLQYEEMLKFFYKRVPLANVTTMFRAGVLKKIGLYPQSIDNEDTLMWFKAFKSDVKLANLDKILVKVRSNDAYYIRRRGWKKAYSDFKDRCYVARELHFGMKAYIYAAGVLLVQLSPGWIQKLAYRYLR